MSRQAYRIDLSAQHAECEANYARLSRLLALLDGSDRGVIGLPDGDAMTLEITERCPYTSTLEVSCVSLTDGWTALPTLTVRIYHDARMAEVIGCASHRRLQPRYRYPNRDMFQPDEKEQWNRFLGEWLSHCLQFGHLSQGTVVSSCEL